MRNNENTTIGGVALALSVASLILSVLALIVQVMR